MRIALPTFLQRDISSETTLPSFAVPLWRLAYIAVGDAPSATMLVAHVLAHSPPSEGAAVRLLAQHLPEGWLSWPGCAGPGEWLRLRLRREQADRLLSILGEWNALERLALGLYLWWDVPRDELDAWLGTEGLSVAVTELIAHAGDSLDLLEPPGTAAECRPFHADLPDALDPHAPQAIRRHLIGCCVCRAHANGLRRSTNLVRHALEVFFRQQPPDDLGSFVTAIRRQLRRVIEVPTPLVSALLVAVLVIGMLLRPQTPPPQAAERTSTQNLSAADILDRALDRFETGLERGSLHERIHVSDGKREMVLDRWLSARDQIRVTLRVVTADEPVFDMTSNGKDWISYQFNPPFGRSSEALLEVSNLPTLLPLLRQLPFVGSFGGMPIDQQSTDVWLLAQARHAPTALLGTSTWLDRPAFLLSSAQPDNTRLLLLIDRKTFSLLRAQIIVPHASTTRTVWQAEVIEDATKAPGGIFIPLSKRTAQRYVNPRQLLSNIITDELPDITLSMNVPIPAVLPDEPIIGYIQRLDGPYMGTVQVYESQWSTVALVSPRIRRGFRGNEQLGQRFNGGRYAVLTIGTPQSTLISFVHDDQPHHHSVAYLWHAFADAAEREQMIVAMLNSIDIATRDNVASYVDRFVPSATVAAVSALPQTERTPLVNKPVAPQER